MATLYNIEIAPFLVMTFNSKPLTPTAGKLQPKTGRTMAARAAAGHRKFLLKRWECAAKQRVNVSSPGSAGFAALALCGKEAFLLT